MAAWRAVLHAGVQINTKARLGDAMSSSLQGSMQEPAGLLWKLPVLECRLWRLSSHHKPAAAHVS